MKVSFDYYDICVRVCMYTYTHTCTYAQVSGEESKVTFTNNKIHSNHGSGVLLFQQASCELKSNQIYGNWHSGIECRDEATLTAEENGV